MTLVAPPASDRPGLPRRAALFSLPALALVPGMARARAPSDMQRAEWFAFRERFVMPEGRIIDTGNQNVSHTEGQGWAMMSAVRADDRESFERILAWTVTTLRRPQDELFAWRFRPGASNPVDDLNNATDGDLFIAWALLEAGERWGNREYTAQGVAMGRDILRLLVRRAGPYTVLLPGARGFERADHTVINPSYYVFPAIRALAQAVPDPAWLRVAADGVVLMRSGRFGRWGLPPDWLAVRRVDGLLTLPGDWAPRFSYDAVRVPLYMAWVGLGNEPGLTGPADFWNDPRHRHMPAWADLTTNSTSPYAASPGISGVAALATARRQGPAPHRGSRLALPGSSVPAMPDYYSGALSLLSTLAARDSGLI
ncbi:glycosyl hydrolase family 8 [Sediminicoccus sp. KRV36]|uniref:glycosyl hydrolase family 8 n=1 Tax=Sediminicoccus sp. KRV36 TaxID=3133721 RepID=UPI00200BCE81|nr:glycosyl hydrolase family 8 [Sediminicoccus rosea]UPY36977.1 glycosyl hydrolase family 5 [Sediminicoccus rosea]